MSDSGYIKDGLHSFPVRVYYEDTDFSGVVYHSNYLKFCERGRTECLRLLGIHHTELAALEVPLAFAVAELNIRYRAPARIDDLLEVTTRLTGHRSVQFELEQTVRRGDQVLAQVRVVVVSIDLSGRPRRFPKETMDALLRLSAS